MVSITSGIADQMEGHTYRVLQRWTDIVQASYNLLQERRLSGLPLAEYHTRPQDNGLLKIQVLDGILNTYLHLGVWRVPSQETPHSC